LTIYNKAKNKKIERETVEMGRVRGREEDRERERG